MNDREQVLLNRERTNRGLSPVDAEEPDPHVSVQEKAARIRALYDALTEQGFDENQALLLTGRLFVDD